MNWLSSLFQKRDTPSAESEPVRINPKTGSRLVSFSSPEFAKVLASLSVDELAAYESVKQGMVDLQSVFNLLPQHEQLSRAEVYAAARQGLEVVDRLVRATQVCDAIAYLEAEKHRQLLQRYEQWFQPLFCKTHPSSVLVAVVDTETTGLSATDEPISVGVVLMEIDTEDGSLLREVGHYYGLREPSVPINPQAQAVHGISISELEGLEFDMLQLHKMLYSADLLVAHNAPFDKRMLVKVEPQIEQRPWACSMTALQNEWAAITGGRKSLKAICDALGINRPEPHDALADCRSLQAVLLSRSRKQAGSPRLMLNLLLNNHLGRVTEGAASF